MITEKRMWKKTLLGLFSVLLIFMAYEVTPIYAIAVPKTSTSVKVSSLRLMGHNTTVAVQKHDTFYYYQHFVSFNATVEIDGVPFLNVTTEEYPLYKIAQEISSFSTSNIPDDWKYVWDGITFVKYPGPPTTYIKYDHPDNYDTYRPGEINVDYQLQGYEKIHYHIAQYRIEESKSDVTLGQIIVAFMGVLGLMLAIPEGVISKLAAGIIALIIAILELLGQAVKWFLESILQTELGDGWTWLWGFGSWWIFKWWWQSFGAWRDWGWFFVIFNWNIYDHIPWVGGGNLFCYMCTY